VSRGVRRGAERSRGRPAAAGKVPPGAGIHGSRHASGEAGEEASPGAAARPALGMWVDWDPGQAGIFDY